MNSRIMALVALVLVAACGASNQPPTVAPVSSTTPIASAPPPSPATATSETDAAVPISPDNPTWGSRTALVTIVEFGDFQCPYCQRVEATLSHLRETYGKETLRIVWKNGPLPFHPNARPAAEAAMGVFALAGVDAFWKFHDAAFANQRSLGADSYETWAKDAGVTNIGAWRTGMAEHTWAATIDADVRDGQSLHVSGVPAFFVNGVFIAGALPFAAFQAVIDDQIQAAHMKIAAGTPPEHVYAELSRENRAKAPPQDDEGDEKEDTKTVFKIPVGGSPVLGNPKALVTIVEFSDFQCPFCARVEPTLKAVRDKYGDKVRIVWKNEPLPFHPSAEPAAEAALEVRKEKGDAGFWAIHDKLFEGQKDLSENAVVKLASDVGASADKVRKAMSDRTHRREIESDEVLADDFQANGTPHFFINGRRLVGAQPEEKFDAIIDEEIAKAQALLTSGTKPEALYDALTRAGQDAPAPETKDLPNTLPTNDPVRGNASAKVTMHEWADFECSFCGLAEKTVSQITHDYGTRVRIVWHDLPLPMHDDAPLAAEAAREAFRQKGPTAFWAMHDSMFSDQQRLKRDDLDGYARTLRLDMGKWKASLDGSAHQSELDADKKAADDLSIDGTPSFVIVPAGSPKGYFINGAQPYAKFRKVIERALAEAK